MTLKQHNRYIARIRELALDVDGLRQRKRDNLTAESAVQAAETFLSDPECNTAIMQKYGDRLLEEARRLQTLPDPKTYEAFHAPQLDDEWEW